MATETPAMTTATDTIVNNIRFVFLLSLDFGDWGEVVVSTWCLIILLVLQYIFYQLEFCTAQLLFSRDEIIGGSIPIVRENKIA